MGFGGSGFFVLGFWVLLWLFYVLGDFVSVVFFVCFCFGFCSGEVFVLFCFKHPLCIYFYPQKGEEFCKST